MNFDIEALEQSTNTTFDVIVGHKEAKDADGKAIPGEPVGFKVLGPGSDAYNKVERDIQILNIKEANTRKEPIDMKTDDGAAVAVDGGDLRRDLVIFACTVDWFGFESSGQPAPFSRENLARVLKARPNWARRLLNAIENEANFVGA